VGGVIDPPFIVLTPMPKEFVAVIVPAPVNVRSLNTHHVHVDAPDMDSVVAVGGDDVMTPISEPLEPVPEIDVNAVVVEFVKIMSCGPVTVSAAIVMAPEKVIVPADVLASSLMLLYVHVLPPLHVAPEDRLRPPDTFVANSIVDELALNVRLVVVVIVHEPPLSSHVPLPKLRVLVAVPVLLKVPVRVTFGLLALKSSVPVNAPIVRDIIVTTPEPFGQLAEDAPHTVTVPPPEVPSNVAVSAEVGTCPQLQLAVLELSQFPVPPCHVQAADQAGADHNNANSTKAIFFIIAPQS